MDSQSVNTLKVGHGGGGGSVAVILEENSPLDRLEKLACRWGQ